MAVQDNPVLYEDPEIKIEFNPNSPEDHIIYLSKRGGEDSRYHIPRGCLEELAKTRRDEAGSKMRILNVDMVRKAYHLGLTVDSLGYAMAQAYIEEKKRYDIYKMKMRREQELGPTD